MWLIARQNSVALWEPVPSALHPIASSGTLSDSEQNQSSRPRPTDHLRHISFLPTHSTNRSMFTRMACGINKEIEATQQQIASTKHTSIASTPNRPASAPVERNLFHGTVPGSEHALSFRNSTPGMSSMKDTTRSRIHLPDVAGLTNAVESPLKPRTQYYPYKAGDRPRDSEARFLQTLSIVQIA